MQVEVQAMDLQAAGASVFPFPVADNTMDYSSVVNDVLLNDCSDSLKFDINVQDVFI